MTPLHHHFEMTGLERAEDRFSVRDRGGAVRVAEFIDLKLR